MTIIQSMGVTTAYNAVDDVAEVNGSIPPMLPLFPRYEVIAWSTVVKNGIYIFLYFEIYGATGGGSKYFRIGSLYFSTLLKN